MENPFKPGDVIFGPDGEEADSEDSTENGNSQDEGDGLPPEPAAPAAVPGDSRVELTWDPVQYADTYTVYGNTSGSPFSEDDILLSGHTGTNYTVSAAALTAGTRYSFAVRAYNGGVAGSLSGVEDCLYVYWEPYGAPAYDGGTFTSSEAPFSLSMENNGSTMNPYVAAVEDNGTIHLRHNRDSSGWTAVDAPTPTASTLSFHRAALEHYQGMMFMGVNTAENSDAFKAYRNGGTGWSDAGSDDFSQNTSSSLGDISVHYQGSLRGFALWAKGSYLQLAECQDLDADPPSWTTFSGSTFPVQEPTALDWPAADVASENGEAFVAFADGDGRVGGVFYDGSTLSSVLDDSNGLPAETNEKVLCVDIGQGGESYYLLVKVDGDNLDLYKSQAADGTSWGKDEEDLGGQRVFNGTGLAALTVDRDGNPYVAMVDFSGEVRVLTPAPSGIWESIGGSFAFPETIPGDGHIAIELDRLTSWDGTGSAYTLRLITAVLEHSGDIQLYRLVK